MCGHRWLYFCCCCLSCPKEEARRDDFWTLRKLEGSTTTVVTILVVVPALSKATKWLCDFFLSLLHLTDRAIVTLHFWLMLKGWLFPLMVLYAWLDILPLSGLTFSFFFFGNGVGGEVKNSALVSWLSFFGGHLMYFILKFVFYGKAFFKWSKVWK